jgi:hypothetical protein
MRDPARSYESITQDDLSRLANIAHLDREDRFERKPRWRSLYGARVIAVALCQGAALHYLDGENGVKDFDVWTFYATNPEAQFPPRWRTVRDFGDPKFGTTADSPAYLGRRVDLIGRSLPVDVGADVGSVLPKYLSAGRTLSARLLAKKAVVCLEPAERIGEIIWPV